MRLKDTKEILNKFAKYVIQQARTNLTREKKNYTKELYDSLFYKINEYKDSTDLLFGGEDYLPFVDLGVKGNDPSKVSPNSKKKKQQAPNSPYRFG
mgnify:FL=1